MVARVRYKTEAFDEYRDNLKEEAVLERRRVKGRWFYVCSMHLNPTTGKIMPYVNYKKKKNKAVSS